MTIMRSHRAPAFPQADVSILHFKAPIFVVDGMAPAEIAAMAKAYTELPGNFVFMGWSEITSLASKDIEALKLTDDD